MSATVSVKISGPAGTGVKSIGKTLANLLVTEGYHCSCYLEYSSLIRGGSNTATITLRSDVNHVIDNEYKLFIPLTQAALDTEINTLPKDTKIVKDFINVGQVDIESVFKLIKNLNLPSKNQDKKILISGNEAVAVGALAAGLNFYSAYPMTPATSIFNALNKVSDSQKIVVSQTEDEISAINMAIGASFAGALSMTASSGGGFALMSESISLAGMVETPLVIALVSRPGPATGLPTWTAQEDLLFAINAGHGEFAKIVLSPSDPEEAYELTHKAFEISQKYQVSVIILSDKYLGETYFSQLEFKNLKKVSLSSVTRPARKLDNGLFTRYAYTPNGIHLRTLPGMEGGEYIAESKEHEVTGLTTESSQERELQVKRRIHKMQTIKDEIPLPVILGKGKNALITWGSNKNIGAMIVSNLKNTAHIHFTYLWPLPKNLTKILAAFKTLTTLENNATGQLAKLITQETAIPINSITSSSGRPIDPFEVINNINKINNGR
jgi:2-oxoglutarate/2-oxoacid ferredoxin oxidoreductase subunit alpha